MKTTIKITEGQIELEFIPENSFEQQFVDKFDTDWPHSIKQRNQGDWSYHNPSKKLVIEFNTRPNVKGLSE
jgi:hypothetical protein